jgi:hypothetical protein
MTNDWWKDHHRPLLVAVIFGLLYASNWLLSSSSNSQCYFVSANMSMESKSYCFISSPWSNAEDNYWINTNYGVVQNGLGVFLFLIFYEIGYMCHEGTIPKLKNLFRVWPTPELMFAIAIAATYIASAISWQHTGYPGTGSSIIGFAILVTFVILPSLNSVYFVKDIVKHKAGRWLLVGLMIPLIFLSLAIVAIPTYLSNSQHIIGGIIFSIGILPLIMFDIFKFTNQRVRKPPL